MMNVSYEPSFTIVFGVSDSRGVCIYLATLLTLSDHMTCCMASSSVEEVNKYASM